MGRGTIGTVSPGPGKRVHIVLRPAQVERLKARARSSGRSMGSLIREAIDHDLGRPVPRSATERSGGAGRRLMAAGTIKVPQPDPGAGSDVDDAAGADGNRDGDR